MSNCWVKHQNSGEKSKRNGTLDANINCSLLRGPSIVTAVSSWNKRNLIYQKFDSPS